MSDHLKLVTRKLSTTEDAEDTEVFNWIPETAISATSVSELLRGKAASGPRASRPERTAGTGEAA